MNRRTACRVRRCYRFRQCRGVKPVSLQCVLHNLHNDLPVSEIRISLRNHHKDENKHNNDPLNLELKDRTKHSKDHNENRLITYVKLKCPNCDKVFTKEKRQTYLDKHGKATFCSKECSNNFLKLDKIQKEIKIKEMFIEEFKA